MKLNTLNDLFVEQLKDVYSAEKQLTKALPKMAKAASNPDLQRAFQQHLDVTEQQKDRLDQIFERLGANPGRTKCEGMAGIISEGDEFLSAGSDHNVMDAALIVAAQKVEHYEIATYGSLRTYATQLGHQDIANMLQQTLDEEGQADKTLTQLAESHINWQAEGKGSGTHMSGTNTMRGTTGTGSTSTRSMSSSSRTTRTRK